MRDEKADADEKKRKENEVTKISVGRWMGLALVAGVVCLGVVLAVQASEDRTASEQEETTACKYAAACHSAGSECSCDGKGCDRCADFVDENGDRVCDKQATCEKHSTNSPPCRVSRSCHTETASCHTNIRSTADSQAAASGTCGHSSKHRQHAMRSCGGDAGRSCR